MTEKTDERIYFSRKIPMVLDGELTPYSTVMSWVEKGVPVSNGKRVFLSAYRRGGKRYTTASAVTKFFAAQNQEE